MKKWTSITVDELSALRSAGAAWALGYLAILKLQAGWGETMHTSVRELAREFGLADFRAVKRVLNALAGAGIIALEQGPKGTFIKLLSLPENGRARDMEKTVGQSSAPALSETQQSAEQNATPAPFPSYSPIPTNETNINKQQEKHVYIKAGGAAKEKYSSPQKEKLRAFADKVALKFESFENQAQKNVWFYRNYKNLRDILAYGGSEQMGLLTIQACAEMLEAKGYSGGYGAVCRNLPLYYEKAKRMVKSV